MEEAAGLYHERKVMANEGQQLITKMDEARLLARRIHQLSSSDVSENRDNQKEIAELAKQIDQLLQSS